MTDKERQLVQTVIARLSNETRGAQRAVEILANLFERLRFYLPMEEQGRIWYLLREIPQLERIPLYPESEPSVGMGPANSYRWFFYANSSPFDLFQSARQMEEFVALLAGDVLEEPKR